MSPPSEKLEGFSEPCRRWFSENFADPTPVQERGWKSIATGAHSLLVAPTGSGKTLAAFLWAIDRCSRKRSSGTSILYISPLKALVVDVERNLRAPLAGVLQHVERNTPADPIAGASKGPVEGASSDEARRDKPLRSLRVDIRTGDTSATDRRRQAKDPAEILVTTPESLFLLIGSAARARLTSVHTVIIDEIHSLAPTKRGAHLALTLERLSDLCAEEPQRIGLSATARPLDAVARYLAGTRACEIVDAHEKPNLDLQICVPMPDMDRPPAPATLKAPRSRGINPLPSAESNEADRGKLHSYHAGTGEQERGIWPAVYLELVEAIRSHQSTLIFVNSRGLSERLTHLLNELAGEELARSHHGSISHSKRTEIENALKLGKLRAIVATSSLELGIDMGALDLVILLESPGSVARGLQRVGRAGHQVGQTSHGRIYPKFKGDLLECAAVSEGMLAGAIEALAIPENPLDVLAQQLVAICVDRTRTVAELNTLVRGAESFRTLPEDAFHSTLKMLTGSFPSTDFADLRPRLVWDRSTDQISARRGSAMVTRMNAGTIPDRGAFPVHLVEGGPRVGELDEEMVHESRPGETVVLGASTWRIQEITRDRVLVSPAPGEAGRLPFWKGEKPGRPLELGRAMGKLLREVGPLPKKEAIAMLEDRSPLTSMASQNLFSYIEEQQSHSGLLPTDKTIVVERFRDELGDWRVCILSPFGNRLHAPWALAIEELLGQRSGFDVQVLSHDDGLALRFADSETLPDLDDLFPEPEDLVELVTRRVGSSALFASLFRENAVRSLMITRRRPGQRNPLWAQRLRARGLLATVERFPDFPIVLETYRQAMSDVFDLPALEELLRDIRAREVVLREVETPSPSPFARSLAFAYVANYLYDEDAPVAERRAQALSLDRDLLRELLGQAELRAMLDPDAIIEVEAQLSGREEGRKARDADELIDVLGQLGDLTEKELVDRSVDGAAPTWLESLRRQQRATLVNVAGEARWIRTEEVSLYRDALGSTSSDELAGEIIAMGSGLAIGETPLEFLVRRFAKTHGPFLVERVRQRFGLQLSDAETILAELTRKNELVRGEIRPDGTELEWCHVEVLRRIKRKTLAILRGQIAAVDASALARFLLEWQGLQTKTKSLLDVVVQLEGLPLPFSTLVEDILPDRLDGFSPRDLDALGASGEIVWIGHGAIGARDGRIAFYRRENVSALFQRDEARREESDCHRSILHYLKKNGASFDAEIELGLGREDIGIRPDDVRQAFWDLVWSGRITNDTFAPLRAYAAASTSAISSRFRGRRGSGGRRFRHRNSLVPEGGRWWLTDPLFSQPTSDTETALARAETLLTRYGIVSREITRSEKFPGGFGAIYRVLSEMEDAGQVRRGWFVEGLSGGQFALSETLEPLRRATPELSPDCIDSQGNARLLRLSAIDPANPYGALLPWPPTETEGAEVQSPARRTAGAYVILVRGNLRLYLPKSRREVWLFGISESRSQVIDSLVHLRYLPAPSTGARTLNIEKVNGQSVTTSPLAPILVEAGLNRGYRAYSF